jgi:hypothetical protein
VTYEHLILKEFEQLNFSVDVDAIAIGWTVYVQKRHSILFFYQINVFRFDHHIA